MWASVFYSLSLYDYLSFLLNDTASVCVSLFVSLGVRASVCVCLSVCLSISVALIADVEPRGITSVSFSGRLKKHTSDRQSPYFTSSAALFFTKFV